MKNKIFIQPINVEWSPGSRIFEDKGNSIISSSEVYNEYFLPFIAEEYIKYLRESIERQKFKSLQIYPLSEKYAERKRRQGLDPRILIATGRYIDSFLFVEERNVIRLTVSDEELDGGISMLKLARILEFGNSKTPRRVHWHTAYRDMDNNIRELYNRFCELL